MGLDISLKLLTPTTIYKYTERRPDNHKHQPPIFKTQQQPRHYYQCIKSSRTGLKRLSTNLFNRNDKINA